MDKDALELFMWILGGMQGLNLLIVGWIKLDISQLWKRANTHGHKIECDADRCKPRTTAVIIHEA